MERSLSNIVECWPQLSRTAQLELFSKAMMMAATHQANRVTRQWRIVEPLIIGDQRQIVVIGAPRRRASDRFTHK